MRAHRPVASTLLVLTLVACTDDRGAPVVESAAPSTTLVAPAPETTVVSPTSQVAATETEPPSSTTTTLWEPIPVVVADDVSKDLDEWMAVVGSLPAVTVPSDCGVPYDVPESMPNSARAYRGGTHQGIDFICAETGREAVAALSGRVVMANGNFTDPTPAEREAVLDTAVELGYTPPWTLAMMFGRFVVLDHGIIDGAGHVVTVYAHFAEIDVAIRPGLWVEAGTRLGEIGNLGTATAAAEGDRPQSLHLHWQLHVGHGFLGQGLGPSETADLYRALFDR